MQIYCRRCTNTATTRTRTEKPVVAVAEIPKHIHLRDRVRRHTTGGCVTHTHTTRTQSAFHTKQAHRTHTFGNFALSLSLWPFRPPTECGVEHVLITDFVCSFAC